MLACLVGLSDLVLAIAPGIWLAAVALAAYGRFALMCTTSANALLRGPTRAQHLGRVLALFTLAAARWATPLHGLVTDWLGPRAMLAIGAAGALALAAAIIATTPQTRSPHH